MEDLLAHLRRTNRYNLQTFRSQPLSEISGSLGDLGTFLPLLIALATLHHPAISLSTSLILTGVYNILTGVAFGIPLPVQPMKAIAAIAVANNMSRGEVAAAGIFVSAMVGLLSATKLLEVVNAWVPVPVVKGVQLGAGLSLVVAAGGKALQELRWAGPSWADNRLWLLATFLFLLVLNLGGRASKIPFALIVTVLGVVFAIITTVLSGQHLPGIRPWHPDTHIPTAHEWRVGILDAGLGQLPLTTLNSVIAVVHLSADLLPSVPAPTVTATGLSVAAMNLAGCWFGALPTCHGSGGLAAQHRFGARSGASVVVLGFAKLILGVVCGDSLARLLHNFPAAFLVTLVLAAGLELAGVGESLNSPGRARDLKKGLETGRNVLAEGESRERWNVMMVTAGLLLAFKNDAVGFLAGMCCHYSYAFARRVERWQREGDSERQPLLRA